MEDKPVKEYVTPTVISGKNEYYYYPKYQKFCCNLIFVSENLNSYEI